MSELIKLFKIANMVKLFAWISGSKDADSSLKFLNLSYTMKNFFLNSIIYFIVTHWVACIWYIQATFRGSGKDTWIGSKDL